VNTLGRDAALERMRAGLMRFLAHHEVDPKKYSEEVTVFWVDQIDAKLKALGPDVSIVEKCRTILGHGFRGSKTRIRSLVRRPIVRVGDEGWPGKF
jgi:hypothetical protein